MGAALLMSRVNELAEELERMRPALALAFSIIQSGERLSPEAEATIRDALESGRVVMKGGGKGIVVMPEVGRLRTVLDRLGEDWTLHPATDDPHDMVARWPSGAEVKLLTP